MTSYYVLTGASMLLLVLGLVMVLSSSSVESLAAGRSPYSVFFNQAQFALVGLPLMWVASRLPSRVYQSSAWLILGGAAVFQLLVYVPGIGASINGNQNWVKVGGFTAQPSEAMKLALAIWLGAVLARKRPLLHEWKHALIPAVPVSGLMIGLVLLGGDLGTALVMMMLVGGALFIAGVPARVFVGAGLAAAGSRRSSAARSATRRARATRRSTAGSGSRPAAGAGSGSGRAARSGRTSPRRTTTSSSRSSARSSV